MVDVFALNRTKHRFDQKKIYTIAKDQLKKRGVSSASLEVEIVGKDRITSLNKKYMGRIGPTDVLSFPLPKISAFDNLIGTIFLCRDIIKLNSTKNSVSFQNEFERNLRHGIDHLVGIHHN
jgi:probable rRNA maturation factor